MLPIDLLLHKTTWSTTSKRKTLQQLRSVRGGVCWRLLSSCWVGRWLFCGRWVWRRLVRGLVSRARLLVRNSVCDRLLVSHSRSVGNGLLVGHGHGVGNWLLVRDSLSLRLSLCLGGRIRRWALVGNSLGVSLGLRLSLRLGGRVRRWGLVRDSFGLSLGLRFGGLLGRTWGRWVLVGDSVSVIGWLLFGNGISERVGRLYSDRLLGGLGAFSRRRILLRRRRILIATGNSDPGCSQSALKARKSEEKQGGG